MRCLLVALVIFKVLDRRHSIKIKKFQLLIFFLLITSEAAVVVLEYFSGAIQLNLYGRSRGGGTSLQSYPGSEMRMSIILEALSLGCCLPSVAIRIYLLMSIGRGAKQDELAIER